ncbi:hypothetical protein, partial [Aeromonas veronii]|uniref:hypothetical protein n=1 Tax=Aeromonas veronii TaxID=654 RepID=UPI00406C4001
NNKENLTVFSSEVGVEEVHESNEALKGQLNPGNLLLVDFKQNKVIENSVVEVETNRKWIKCWSSPPTPEKNPSLTWQNALS